MSRLLFPVAVHLVLDDGAGGVLFARRANTGFADGFWGLPAGHVEAGETLVEACVREAHEELDVTLDRADLVPVCVQQKHDVDGEERLDVFFSASLPPGAQPRIAEPDKCDALCWSSPQAPPRPVVADVAHALLNRGAPTASVLSFGY